MKILYFHQHFITPSGGGGIRSFVMARTLIERGHHVIMVCGSVLGGNTGLCEEFNSSGYRRGFVNGIDVIEMDLAYSNSDSFFKRAITFIKFAFRSVKLVFSENYDLVFATTTPLTVGIPGVFARWFRGKVFVFEVRDLWPELPRAMGVIKNPFILWLMSVLEWVSYHSASRLIGLSPGIVQGISKRGIQKELIKMIPNGCDFDIFSISTSCKWRPPEIQESEFLAIFTGAHGIANGLNSILDTASELKKRGRSDIKILLVGQGKLKKNLEERAQSEELSNVIFSPQISKSKVASLMASADVGLQVLANVPAFYYGTSPNKFFDYISAGLPVIINYPGWLADQIIEYDCGYVVPPNNPIAFADALVNASNDKVSLREKGKNSFSLATNLYDRKMLAQDWMNWVLEGR